MTKNLLVVSPSPHVKDAMSIEKIMYLVIIALMPALLSSVWFFGIGAIRVILLSVIFCMVFEYLIQKFMLKGQLTILDGSAVITGILLGFNLPSDLPTWMIAVGSLVAIGIAKMAFGGLGQNPFNPALVGRVFLLISFSADMSRWPTAVASRWSFNVPDALTNATPLGIIKDGLASGGELSTLMAKTPSYLDMFLGNTGGSLGEVSALALLIGGVFLIYKKIISWHIPVSFILGVVVLSGILWLIDPTKYNDPIFHLVTGGIMMGAFFMATDLTTSPMSKSGMLIFGFFIGIITILIRVFGSYPEGVSFAILIMNAFVPLINIKFKPKKFGV
jgi:electron transport complex protein RnfD